MKFTIRLFAGARDIVGSEFVELEFPAAPCIGDVRRRLGKSYPSLAPLSPHLLFAINEDYCRDDDPVPANSEIACFPPVSGG